MTSNGCAFLVRGRSPAYRVTYRVDTGFINSHFYCLLCLLYLQSSFTNVFKGNFMFTTYVSIFHCCLSYGFFSYACAVLLPTDLCFVATFKGIMHLGFSPVCFPVTTVHNRPSQEVLSRFVTLLKVCLKGFTPIVTVQNVLPQSTRCVVLTVVPFLQCTTLDLSMRSLLGRLPSLCA